MKRILTILLAALLVAAVSAPVFAWEFSMTGDFTYRFRYLSRTGSNDLYGIQTPAAEVGFAGPDIWTTNAVNSNPQVVQRGFSAFGSDAMYADGRLRLAPEIRVNKAIRVRGVYNVGGLRNRTAATAANVGVPAREDWFMERSGDSILSERAHGYWEQLFGSFQLPWGIISYGLKNFPFGIGATAHGDITASDSFALVVPYGPFTFLQAIHLARHSVAGPLNALTNPDRSAKNTFFGATVAMYRAGNVDMGAFWYPWWTHLDQAYSPNGFAWDLMLNDFDMYFKYNNGRFFTNLEYYFLDQMSRYVGLAPANVEGYGAFAEIGTVVGPSKLSLVWAQASGSVANTGNPTKAYADHSINPMALAPYQWLIFETYGGGNDQYQVSTITGPSVKGSMSDAYCLAARLDYAAASNLNLYGSFLWATRLEKFGTLVGAYTGGVAGSNQAAFAANLGMGQVGYIPADDLGWEAGVGVDWKLLEHLTWKQRYHYWQPGEWFTFAYQGTINGRTSQVIHGRDAIHAYEGSLVIDF